MPLLGELATIKIGYQRTNINEDQNGTHWLINAKDFNRGQAINKKCLTRFFPERKPEQYIINKGDVLLKARGTNHFSYYISHDMTNTLASDSFYIIRLNSNNLLPGYLAWWLNQLPAQKYFKSKAGASLMSFITLNELIKLKPEMPPLTTQEQIINVTNLWEKEQLLNKKLNEFRSSLINTVYKTAIQEKESL